MKLRPQTYPLIERDLEKNKDIETELSRFFISKSFLVQKEEERLEKFYEDWIQFQGKHEIYYKLLSKKSFAAVRLASFMERFAFYAPPQGYSLQVSLLGIVPIWMSENAALQNEAEELLKNGGVFAFGLSEKHHGADIYSNEMVLKENEGGYIANGNKYYIGNANCASMVSVLGRFENKNNSDPHDKNQFVFFSIKPNGNPHFKDLIKIKTLGIRNAFVGGFKIENYTLSAKEIISTGHSAWDAVFGTVNLGKFFLGFGSIGICERALSESLRHTKARTLYGKSVFSMPHVRKLHIKAYVRMYAMKLFAARALDYLVAASENDRRYLLFNSIQKAKVTTEGVKVIHDLSEAMGAKGFETDQYFENAQRDIILLPGLEGSTHINFGLVAQFMKNYFFDHDVNLPDISAAKHDAENEYLFSAKTGSFKKIKFRPFDSVFKKYNDIQNVKIFTKQISSFKKYLISMNVMPVKDLDYYLAASKVFSNIPYAQLILEKSFEDKTDNKVLNLIFMQLISQFNQDVISLLEMPASNKIHRFLLKQCIFLPITEASDWDIDPTI